MRRPFPVLVDIVVLIVICMWAVSDKYSKVALWVSNTYKELSRFRM